ncbi:site-2 protease family protein [Nanoarchaeota archaeon]
MRGGTKLFTIFGIDIKIHFSWWFIFALLAYTLSADFFPHYFSGLTTQTYWAMGIVSSVLLFVCVLAHELAHSLMARAKKIEVESITLFFFGGVASLPREDMKPSTEFWMAFSGPLLSLSLGGILYVLYSYLSWPTYIGAVLFYLYQINLILAIFNLLPGYPLDGGRMFRALLMMHYKDLRKATAIAAKGGKFLGGLLVIFGFLGIFLGSFGGLWFIFLGGFLWFIAGLSYQQILIKQALSGMKVEKMLKKKFITLSPKMTLGSVVRKYHAEEQPSFVVGDGKKFLGILNLQKIGKIPKGFLGKVLVGNVMIPAGKIKVIQERDHAYVAFRKMSQQNLEMLPVLKQGRIMGVVYKHTLTHYLIMRLKYNFKF